MLFLHHGNHDRSLCTTSGDSGPDQRPNKMANNGETNIDGDGKPLHNINAGANVLVKVGKCLDHHCRIRRPQRVPVAANSKESSQKFRSFGEGFLTQVFTQ